MSFDLVIFAPSHVPQDKARFLAWFNAIRGGADDFRYPDAENCVPELKGYFEELKTYLPWQEEQPEAAGATDYAFARYLIHCSFPWSSQSKAYDTALALCWRLKMGLYDISGNGAVIFPEEAWDAIESRSRARRPWWKFWGT